MLSTHRLPPQCDTADESNKKTSISQKREKTLTLVQYPERGKDVAISLLEEQWHAVAADQRHPVLALGDRHVALLRQDVLQVRL